MADALDDDLIVIALKRHGEWWAVQYRPRKEMQVVQQFGRWAANVSLAFTWHDAAELAREVRTMADKRKATA